MKVYLVLGYNLVTGNQDVVDYVVAEDEGKACRRFERRNTDCEANDVFLEGTLEEFIEDAPEEFDDVVEDIMMQAGVVI